MTHTTPLAPPRPHAHVIHRQGEGRGETEEVRVRTGLSRQGGPPPHPPLPCCDRKRLRGSFCAGCFVADCPSRPGASCQRSRPPNPPLCRTRSCHIRVTSTRDALEETSRAGRRGTRRCVRRRMPRRPLRILFLVARLAIAPLRHAARIRGLRLHSQILLGSLRTDAGGRGDTAGAGARYRSHGDKDSDTRTHGRTFAHAPKRGREGKTRRAR